MDKICFLKWLQESKNMTIRSSKDVLSRCQSVKSLINCSDFDETTINELISNEIFKNKSIYVKSQLKRCVSLYLEFKGVNNEV